MIIPESLPAQDPYCPTCRKKDAQKPYLDLTIGWVPKKMYNAGKLSVSVNNLVYKRFGFYTSFEKGFGNNYSSHVIGGTATIYRTIYLFGGLDWYTRFQGVFFKKSIVKARKEIGIGVSLFTYGMVRYGYSFQVGHSMTVGIKMPLEKINRLFYKRI